MDADQLGIDDVTAVVSEIFGIECELNRDELVTFCPVHEADHAGHNPSCGVNTVTGLANCWSCDFKGDLIDFGVVAFLGVDWKVHEKRRIWQKHRIKVIKLLSPNDPDAITTAISRRVRATRRAANARVVAKQRSDVLIPPLSAYTFKFPKDLRERGFHEETLHRWNIRYAKEATLLKEDGKSFTLTHAVAIPIFDPKQKLLGYCYRATEKSDAWFQRSRYIYTPKLTETLNHMWFGMHLHKNEPEVAITEGALDAMWCDQNGIPALAILGSQVKQTDKIRALMNFRKITLFTDRDLAGSTTARKLGEELLSRGVPVDVVRYSSAYRSRKGEPAKDAQDLCPLDLELAHARAIPYMLWRREVEGTSSAILQR